MAKNIEQLFNDFIFHCQYEKNLSDKTIKAYKIDLKQFCGKSKNLSTISDIDKFVLKKYIKSLYETNKTKTIKRKIATLKAFFNYLEFEDIITVNPFRKIKIKLKEEKRLPKTLTFLEIKIIFRCLYDYKNNFKNQTAYSYKALIRDIAIIELLFATGIRIGELCNLNFKNINLQKGWIRIIGKGDKERVIHFCEQETINALKEYSNLFKTEIDTNGYFFINRLKKQISEQSVRFMIKKYAAKFKIKRLITPHMFRHTVATLLLEADVDIRYIQEILGHSSIMTTQIYTQVNERKQRQIMSKKHPRNKFQINHPEEK